MEQQQQAVQRQCALQQGWRELGRDAAGDAGSGYSAHTGLAGYSGTPQEN